MTLVPLATIAAVAPFSSLSPTTQAALANLAERRHYEADQIVFAEGDPAEWAFIVESGRLAETKRTADGIDVHLRVVGPGEAGGLTSVVTSLTTLTSESKRSASLRAIEPSVLLVLPRALLSAAILEFPELGRVLAAFFSAKVRLRTAQLATLIASQSRDPREIIAFFDARPYDQAAFEKRLPADLRIRFFESHLSASTASLANGYPIVCVFVNDDLSRRVLEQIHAEGVSLVALRCAGYNNVDLKAAEEFGISVVRVPAYSPHAVAEHAMALISTLNRKTHRAYNRVREGNFSLQGLEGFDLHGRTAGVVGMGKIGRCLAEGLRGFGMNVLGYDTFVDEAYAARVGIRYVGLDQLLAESDIVSLHAPLLPSTHHLINEQRIATMKRGVMIINTSRGALIDAAALIEGLKSGQVGSAGLDVYEEESKYFFEDLSSTVIDDDVLARLTTFNNVLVTSHQAFLTVDALDNIAETTIASIQEFREGRRGKALTHAVVGGSAKSVVHGG